jgi:cytochrome b subunit of formate dehydrogenase
MTQPIRARGAPLALCLAAGLLSFPAKADERPAADAAGENPPRPALLTEIPQSARACLTCHAAPLFDEESFRRSVHQKRGCIACHEGYDFSTHRAAPEELVADEQKLAARFAKKSRVPAALLACRGCHEDAFDELVTESVHGRWLREERPAAGPLCFDCHGSPHAIVRSGEDRGEKIHARSRRCVACHSDAGLMTRVGVPEGATSAYRDSLHGRMLALGNERAPSCADCHGSHHILGQKDPRATVFGENKVRTCGKCHAGASAAFASLVTHKSLHDRSERGPRFVHAAFSWLTALTLLGLFLHIVLDVAAELRRRWARGHGRPEAPIPAFMPKTVRRFDLHVRIQHWLLMSGVVLLVLTGFPLRTATLGASQALASFFGGMRVLPVVHRAAAFLLISAAIYHLGYLAWRVSRRDLRFSMIPAARDLSDAYGNIAYFLGLRKERPKFAAFSYIEKFDYWAVFWGVVIMVGSGFLFWFPTTFTRVLPGWVVLGAQLAHGEEATLAGLALFVWHFYNVHLRPSIFPMSWTWLDGKIGIEQLREEHGEVYDQLLANGGRDPTSESSSAIGPAVQPTRGGPGEKEGPE